MRRAVPLAAAAVVLTLKLRNSATLRTRIFDCASVESTPDSVKRETALVVRPAEPADAEPLSFMLGEEYEFDIGFVTNFAGSTIQIIRAGSVEYLSGRPRPRRYNGGPYERT